jgi:hypothetical protein
VCGRNSKFKIQERVPAGSVGNDGAIHMARECKCLVAFENVWTNNQAHFKAFTDYLGALGIFGLSTMKKPTAG